MPALRIVDPGQTAFAGKAVVFLGRLIALPRRAAAAAVTERGGTVRRGVSRRTQVAVVGHGAHRLLGGRVGSWLVRAEERGVHCLSENGFLRTIGRRDPLPASQRSMSLGELAGEAGLDVDTARLLALFDVIEPADGACGFRDLIAAREVARLRGEGVSLPDILASLHVLWLRDHGAAGPHLARVKLTRSEVGGLVMKLGAADAELDGQLRLPMGEGEGPRIDDLFASAESAEEAGDLDQAEALYRRCLDIDRSDPTISFNLANVLRDKNENQEARLHLERALALDPDYAEAWYNLADLRDAGGDAAGARAALESAVTADPEYADAVFNLAEAHVRRGAYDDAVRCFERYLALDPGSGWSERARHSLTLCKRQIAMARAHGRKPAS